MKKIASLFFSLALVSSVVAGPVDYDTKSSKDTKIVPPPPVPATCFGPGFDIGFFGGAQLWSHRNDNVNNRDWNWNDHGRNRDGAGGGVLFEYFFNDFVGVQGNYGAFGPSPVHHNYGGDLVLRYPFQEACIAPYILLGGGGVADGQNLGFWDAGLGVEARFPSFNKMAVFLDGAYHWVGGDREHDYTLVRLGVKFLF